MKGPPDASRDVVCWMLRRLGTSLASAVMTISHSKPCTQLLGIIATGRRDYRILGTDMPTIDDCKRNAEQCLRWADEAANNEQRDTLLEIAALWTQMELSCADPIKWTELLRSQ